MRVVLKYAIILCIIQQSSFAQLAKTSDDTSPYLRYQYFGQKPPDSIPEVFAPGIVSTNLHEHSFPSFSNDGNHVIWSSGFIGNYTYKYPLRIIHSKQINGIWSEPDFFSDIQLEIAYEAFHSPAGNRIYFTSTIEQSEFGKTLGKQDIWYIEKSGNKWNSPQNMGTPINTCNDEFQPTVTNNLTLYFVGYADSVKNNYGIYRSEFVNGQYKEPELLPKQINSEYIDWTPFIAPDESYILFSSFRPGGYGSGDIYISFLRENKTWSEPLNLGETINGPGNERYPYISPDGKYLFFVSDKVDEELSDNRLESLSEYKKKYNMHGNGWGDVYWIKADFIKNLESLQDD